MISESPRSDPYEVLGIDAGATEAQVRKAWRKRTKGAGPGTPEFTAINDAAELLFDPERRAAYDANVAALREAAEQEAAEAAAVAAGEVSQAADPGGVSVAESPRPADEPAHASRMRGMFVAWKGTVTIAGCLALVAIVLAVWQGVVYTSGSSTKIGGPGTGSVTAASFEQSQADQQAAISTVKTGLPAVLGYRFDKMPVDQADAERFLTAQARPGLAASYQRLINGGAVPGCKSTLAPIASRQTVVTATVVSAGVVSVGNDVAQIGAFVNQATTVAGQAAVTTQNRVLVNLKKVKGSWLIDTMTVPNTDHVLSC